MEQVRQIFQTIGKQLGELTQSQKLLIGSLAVIVAMTLFLVSQYAGAAKMVELIPTGTPEDQERARTFLMSVGYPVELVEGRVVVPAERQFPALAQLAKAQVLPDDKELMFRNLVEKQNMFMPKGQLDQMYTTALTNELSRVIKGFDGIEDARVFISAPESRGIGVAARRPVAQVTVFTGQGSGGGGGVARGLDQRTVDALADVVAGSVAGLDIKNVSIVDGTSRRRYRATSPEESAAQSYIEQVVVVEDRVRQKIDDHLSSFIGGVVVSVNAIIDGGRREMTTEEALPKNQGTVSLPIRETNSTTTSNNAVRGAEPGLSGNVELDINRGGGSGNSTNTETTENESVVKFGTKRTVQQDARGRPTKINVAVSVPREWVLEILKGKAAAGAATGGTGADPAAGSVPDDAQIDQEWTAQQQRLIAMIRPLVDTKDVPGTIAEAGDVVVSLMPLALLSSSGTGGAGGRGTGGGGSVSDGGGGTLSGVLSGGVIKQAVLGVLALLALGMIFVMVKKAGKAAELPTAEELVGVPPALQADTDLVGEADEGTTPMIGIEVDTEALKTGKMLEEVQDLVKKNPQAAATVFSRWLTAED